LNPSPAAINYSKLDHFNGLHIRALSALELANRIQPFLKGKGLDPDMALLLKIAPIIQERLVTLDDAVELSTVYFEQEVHPNPEDLIVPGLSAEDSLILAKKIRSIFENLPNLQPATAEPPMRQLVDDSGLKAGQVFGQVRVAVTGRRVSPPLFESIEILGKDKVINRLNQAVILLENLADQNSR
jgi:glutamyl-tRNA synthetase